MTDTYRTPVNPYALKATEAHAKLTRQRDEATQLEAQRVAILCEINDGIAPLRVTRSRNLAKVQVELSHPDGYRTIHLCDEHRMLTDLPAIIGSVTYAEAAEKLLSEAEETAQRNARYDAMRAERLAQAEACKPSPSVFWPVTGVMLSSVAGTSLSCAITGDWSFTRTLFVFVISLTINTLWFRPFKNLSTP